VVLEGFEDEYLDDEADQPQDPGLGRPESPTRGKASSASRVRGRGVGGGVYMGGGVICCDGMASWA
jgi:hypothetical protein